MPETASRGRSVAWWPRIADAVTRSHEDEGTAAATPTSAPNHAVVTGAADGIGKALVCRLSKDGSDITGVDVDEARSRMAERRFTERGTTCRYVVGDLGDAKETERTIRELLEGDPIDLLVHSAGINAVGRLPSLDLDVQMKVVAVNLTAPMVLTARLLEAEHIRPGGTIVFVSSLSHYVGYPGASVYTATKDGIASFARSLRVALRDRGINVLTVYPGPTRTQHARRYSPDNAREHKRMAPEDLAERITRAIDRRQQILIPGWENKQAARLGVWLPRVTERAMAKSILRDHEEWKND